jgi:O-antigen ligase
MPIGSGVGSFPSFYSTVEKPADLLTGTYANHAHNDFLELWLETGFMGPILLVLFLIWVGGKAIAAWAPPNPNLPPLDQALIRASILVVFLLLGHSLVDYPLRTSAMMGLFAFACGLLIDPQVISRRPAHILHRSHRSASS